MTTQSLSLLLYISTHPLLLRLSMVATLIAIVLFINFIVEQMGKTRLRKEFKTEKRGEYSQSAMVMVCKHQ